MTKKKEDLIERSVEQRLNDLLSKTTDFFHKSYILHEKMERHMRDIKRDNNQCMKVIVTNFQSQSKNLGKTAKVMEMAEETLMNVLQAIRQNEYLQAHYPEQHGFKEMKVVGVHPAKKL